MAQAEQKRFGGFKAELEDSSIIIFPIPFDLTSSWQKGARLGPDAVLDASGYLETFDIETQTEVAKRGIYTMPPLMANDSESLVSESRAIVSSLLKTGKFVVTLGGEHSVSIGPALAHAKRFGELSVLQLDAHTDLRDEYEGSKYSHACTMARIREGAAKTVAVGIRSMDSSELPASRRYPVFFAHEIARKKNWQKEVIKALGKNVYVTIDVDVFENGIMPSTGTPEPGGLRWYDVMGLLALVSKKRRIVGFDVTELCPGQNRAPDFLVAKLTYQFLSYLFYYSEAFR